MSTLQAVTIGSEGKVEVWLLARGRGERVVVKPRLKLCKACTKEKLVEAFQGM